MYSRCTCFMTSSLRVSSSSDFAAAENCTKPCSSCMIKSATCSYVSMYLHMHM